MSGFQKEGVPDFQWQGGYAGFSVSQSNLEQVEAYIVRQHHKEIGFQDELRALCGSIKWNGMSGIYGIERASKRTGATPLELRILWFSNPGFLLRRNPGL